MRCEKQRSLVGVHKTSKGNQGSRNDTRFVQFIKRHAKRFGGVVSDSVQPCADAEFLSGNGPDHCRSVQR